MEYITIQKNLTSSPRKLRLVADMVRKMSPDQALLTLRFTNTAAAPLLAKAIKTVLANAGNSDGLVFKSLEVNEGLKMRRIRIGTAGRGRNRPYKKRMSSIKIIVTDEIQKQEARIMNQGKKAVKSVEDVVIANTEVLDNKVEVKKEAKKMNKKEEVQNEEVKSEDAVIEGEVISEGEEK